MGAASIIDAPSREGDAMRTWITRGLVGALALVGTGMIGLLVYAAVLSASLSLPKSDEHPPLLIYGAPFFLEVGTSIAETRLLDRLHRLGYRPVTGLPRHPGDYAVADEALHLYLHAQEENHVPARRITLALADGIVTEVQAESGGPSEALVSLEAPLISGMRGGSRQMREWIPLSRIPRQVIDTLIAVEDRRFYAHLGIDPIAVGRALWANVARGGVVQGGSTITQQLAKNLFYSPQRTMGRKLRESVAALVLETKYRKDDILESYLNEIYLGQAGSVAIYGVGEAAHRYFGKPLDELTTEEIALIVGLIKGPNTYAPTKNLEAATNRRNVVLRRLRDAGRLTEEGWKEAVNRPVRVTLSQDVLTDAPYFIDYLLRQVEEGTGIGIPEGARIYTTLDPFIQEAATNSLQQGLSQLETTYPELKTGDHPLQAAAVVLAAKSGHVLAMVGGRDYRTTQFNRAVQSRRQAGSLVKPFVYLAAFEASREEGRPTHTPATLLQDEPVTFESGNGAWSPQNYDRQFHGQVSLRSALEHSYNVPAVRVAHQIGLPALRTTFRGFGLDGLWAENLSIALGSTSVSLLDIATAYGGLANGGVLTKPLALFKLVNEAGDGLWTVSPDRRQAVSPQAAYLVTSLLKGVVERGTGAKVRALGVEGPVAGKTGTTDGYRDAWFVGYSPDLVIGVWVGFDDERPVKLTGSQAALPIWSLLARRVMAHGVDFEMPPGMVQRDIDPRTGQLATARCPEKTAEVFIAGTEPTIYCEIHGGGLWERVKQTLGLS
jgi:penicillin-binding protein 1B